MRPCFKAVGWLAIGLASLAAGCGAGPPSPATALDRVRARGELRWGADEQGGEPYVYEDRARGGALAGFEVDLAEAIARALGVRARFVQNDWTTLVPSLERGTFDIALNGLEVTPALATRVAFSRPYYVFSERLVARKGDARVRDLASLRGLRVGTLANSQAAALAERAGAIVIAYEGVDEPFVDCAHGRNDAVLLDDIIVDRYARRHPELAVVGDVDDGRYAIALRPADRELREAVDGALGALIASGAWRATLARHGLDGPRQALLATAGAPAAPDSPIAEAAAGPPPAAPRRLLTSRQVGLFLQGALLTLFISLAAMAIATPLGLGLALARLRGRRLGVVAAVYVELVRGTPVLLQLYILYYGLAGVVALGPWTAAVLGLGLNYAAYEAEIFRGAFAAIPSSQWESAATLGMPRRSVVRHVVLPQAFRIATPGVTNDFISLLKDSSLVSVLTVVELTKRMTITAVDNHSWLLPGLLCAALYFLLGYPFARLARRLERRLGRARP